MYFANDEAQAFLGDVHVARDQAKVLEQAMIDAPSRVRLAAAAVVMLTLDGVQDLGMLGGYVGDPRDKIPFKTDRVELSDELVELAFDTALELRERTPSRATERHVYLDLLVRKLSDEEAAQA